MQTTPDTFKMDVESFEEVTLPKNTQAGEGGAGGEGEGEGGAPPSLLGDNIKLIRPPPLSEINIRRLFLISMIGQLTASIIGFILWILNLWPLLLIPFVGAGIQVFTRAFAIYNLFVNGAFAFLGVVAVIGNRGENGQKVLADPTINIYFYVSIFDWIVTSILIILCGPAAIAPFIMLSGATAVILFIYAWWMVLGWSVQCFPCWCPLCISFCFGVIPAAWIAVIIANVIALVVVWLQLFVPFVWAGTVLVFLVFDVIISTLFLIQIIVAFITGIVGIVAAFKYHKAQTAPAPAAEEEQ